MVEDGLKEEEWEKASEFIGILVGLGGAPHVKNN